MTDPISHIARRVPPWRKAAPLTECGRDPSDVGDVIELEQAIARWKKEGAQRAAYTMCMTCVGRVNGYSRQWESWEDHPLRFLARDQHGPHMDVANRELHALAALVAAHPEEFAALLGAGNDLAARRAAKKGRHR